MDHGNGLSRGDRNRNSRLTRLRELVPPANAIAAIDLAGEQQMLVVTDHDSRVLARRTFRLAAWHMGAALDWAAEQASNAGFAGVTVACDRVFASVIDESRHAAKRSRARWAARPEG